MAAAMNVYPVDWWLIWIVAPDGDDGSVSAAFKHAEESLPPPEERLFYRSNYGWQHKNTTSWVRLPVQEAKTEISLPVVGKVHLHLKAAFLAQQQDGVVSCHARIEPTKDIRLCLPQYNELFNSITAERGFRDALARATSVPTMNRTIQDLEVPPLCLATLVSSGGADFNGNGARATGHTTLREERDLVANFVQGLELEPWEELQPVHLMFAAKYDTYWVRTWMGIISAAVVWNAPDGESPCTVAAELRSMEASPPKQIVTYNRKVEGRLHTIFTQVATHRAGVKYACEQLDVLWNRASTMTAHQIADCLSRLEPGVRFDLDIYYPSYSYMGLPEAVQRELGETSRLLAARLDLAWQRLLWTTLQAQIPLPPRRPR